MDLRKIPPGVDPPWDVNVLIEIPLGGEPVKYEVDPESGALWVDRFLHTAMFYPCNYGFVPNTLADDGDPVDVLVAAPARVVPGSVIRCRPVGMLVMQDEEGEDAKVLAVPVDDLHPFYRRVHSYTQLPAILLDQIAHFFQHYKDLEPTKWVKLGQWRDEKEAGRFIEESIRQAKTRF